MLARNFKILLIAVISLLLLFEIKSLESNSISESPQSAPQIKEIFSDIPFYFEQNQGQTDRTVKFFAHGTDYGFYFKPGEVVIALTKSEAASVLRMKLKGGNKNSRIVGMEPLSGKLNYILGNDPTQWHTNITTYAKVKYENIYPGIDLIFYSTDGKLEYDFVVSPGADLNQIRVEFNGSNGIELQSSGDLKIGMTDGDLIQLVPVAYQRKKIANAGYVLNNKEIGFHVSYDHSKPLIIDPQISYGTYLGGTNFEVAEAMAVDPSGAVYVTGYSASTDFPTKNPIQTTAGTTFVTKLSPDGSSLIFSTFIGGNNSHAEGIAVDPAKAIYITGQAGSNYPLKNPIQTRGGGFLTKLSPNGASLVYSTYIGGSAVDQPKGIRLDKAKNAYVFGQTFSKDFPVKNPVQAKFGGGDTDGFWMKVNNSGNKILFSTYTGGNNTDSVDSLVLDPKTGKVYAGGGTFSSNFPKAAVSPINELSKIKDDNCSYWAIVFTVISLNAYGTFEYDNELANIALKFDCKNSFANQLVADRLMELSLAPFGNEPFNQGIASGGLDAHITSRDLNLNILQTIAFGGSSTEYANAIATDNKGRIYVGGDTTSNDLPLKNPVQSVNRGRQDGFVAVFDQNFQLLFSTYIGGTGFDSIHDIKVDPKGNIYVTGFTDSSNLKTTPHAFQKSRKGPQFSNDAFIFKITPVVP
jgi:hypothetical protein